MDIFSFHDMVQKYGMAGKNKISNNIYTTTINVITMYLSLSSVWTKSI